MRYEIKGETLPVVICYLEDGETMITESGSMSWMSPNMKMETTSNGGVGKAIGRMFAGEKIFQNRYTAEHGNGMIAFASSFPGFRDIVHNKGIRNKLEAWLEFLSTDSPEEIAELVEAYPEFRKLYAEVYGLCLNVERVMEMFSKELQELDRNTVQYMIDEMQEEIDEQRQKLDEKEALILSLQEEIKQLKQEHEK